MTQIEANATCIVPEVVRTWISPELFPNRPGVIGVRDIVDYYFPESASLPKAQVAEAIMLVNQLLIPSNESFYIDHESMLPVLSRNLSESSPHHDIPSGEKPPCFKLFIQFRPRHYPNHRDGYDYVTSTINSLIDNASAGNTTLMWLNQPINIHVIDPKDFGFLGERTRICRLQRENNSLGYLILQAKETHLGLPYFAIRYAIEDQAESKVDQPRKLKTAFTFELSYNNDNYNHRHQTINWDDDGKGEWLSNVFGEPFVQYKDEKLSVLNQPLIINSWEFDTLYKICARYYDGGPQLSKEEKRNARSRYYLELTNVAAKTLFQAVFNETNVTNEIMVNHGSIALPKKTDDAIEPYTKLRIKEELHSLGRNKTDINGACVTPATNQYTPGEYLIYDRVWKGKNIWKDVNEFSELLTRAYHHNPQRFWYYFFELGLDHVLPYYRNLTDSNSGIGLPFVPGMFDLIPSLSKYHDIDQQKEYEQSDEYFMQACLALASYALEEKMEPFSALVVKDGKIISYAHNEISYDGFEEIHAETIAMAKGSKSKEVNGDKTLSGCTLFSSATPCDACTYSIRRRKGIEQIKCGVETNQANLDRLTDPTLHLTEEKAGPPPVVTIGILEDDVHKFYTEVAQYTYPFIKYKRGLRIIDTRHRDSRIAYFHDEPLVPIGVTRFKGEPIF